MSQVALLIGGAGFLGRAVMKSIAEQGYDYKYYIFDNESVKPAEPPRGQEEFFHGDACSYEDMRQLFMEIRPSVIIWLAARQGYEADYANYAHVNVCAPYLFFEFMNERKSHRPDRIVLASTQAVYAPGQNLIESANKFPPSVYGITKLQQEMAFHHFSHALSIPMVALRFSIILGAGQSLQSTENGLLRNWYHSWRRREAPKIYGDGNQVRDFVHINDAADALAYAATRKLTGKSVFNVGGVPKKINEMGAIFQKLSRCKEPVITNEQTRPGGEYSLTCSSDSIREEWGWSPTRQPEEQVKDFLSFQKKMEDSSK
jgi:nucleoside-diphosphate-sugar epimerase